MTIIRCKMCGGELSCSGGTIATCDYCGTQQTLPRLDNDRVANLYDRAGHFRRNNEFDKAMGIYEQILNENTTDAEAYWSLVLCRYGIEYVEDPATHQRIPTVNRTQFTSIFDDDNYRSALQYADDAQRAIYETEARAINEIQKGILAISRQEEPFDVFICYKETDAEGNRTQDSVIAQELYYELTEMGYKVFFSRITLEDKLGSAYEPFIFAALNSSKVMVALGTKPEHFRAVWVKNEWSRYLAMIKSGEKKMLIPAYRGMDPYDLPEEFSHLQAQDMSKLGFMQDLVRGIQKLVGSTAASTSAAAEPKYQANASVAPLIKRIELFLENGDWDSAVAYCEKVLDMDPENGKVYVYQLLAQLCVPNIDRLRTLDEPFAHMSAYKNVIRFADIETAERLEAINKEILRKKQDRAAANAKAEQERKALEAKRYQERLQSQAAANARAKQEETRRYQENLENQRSKISQLEEEQKNKKMWGIILLFVWWPIGVFLLYRASKIKKEIEQLKYKYSR